MSTYSNLSPYYSTSFNGAYLDVATFRDIPSEADDINFEVTPQYEYRPDLLAYDLYGDSRLWWVFSVRNVNVIKDPIYDLYAGQNIYLPKLSSLKILLGF
jgi:hypothetical protein